LDNLILRDVLYFGNDEYLIVGEEIFFKRHSNHGVSHSNAFYKSIYLVKINSFGKEMWSTKVTKNQKSDNMYALSYVYTKCNEKLYMIYNDDIDNITSDSHSDLFSFGGLTIVREAITIVELNSDGTYSRELLYRYKKGLTTNMYQPGLASEFENCSVFLPGTAKFMSIIIK
jgi:hypothetical protein